MNSPESKSMMVAKAVVKKDSAKLLSPVDLKRLLEHKAPLSERRPKTAPSETKQRFSTPEGTGRRKRKKLAGSPSSNRPNSAAGGQQNDAGAGRNKTRPWSSKSSPASLYPLNRPLTADSPSRVLETRVKVDGMKDELLQARKNVRKIGMELRASAHRNRLLELRNAKLHGSLKSLERLRSEGRLSNASSNRFSASRASSASSSQSSRVLSNDKYGGAALDAAQDMVLYLRNEIAVLKEELEKVRVENMGLKEKIFKKTDKNVMEITSQRCDRLASLIGSIATSGTVLKKIQGKPALSILKFVEN